MTKGGTRPGAGRKSNWSTSKTVNIRVPEYLVTEIRAYAQQLDRQLNKQQIDKLQQEQLITLLEGLVNIPLEERREWINALPEASRASLRNAQGKGGPSRMESKYHQYSPSDSEQDTETVSPLDQEIKVGLETYDIPGDMSAVLSVSTLGHKWLLQKSDGKLIIDLPGTPQENLSLFVDGEVVFLQVCSKWEVSCILPQDTAS